MNNLILEIGMLIGLALNPNLKNSDTQIMYTLLEKNFNSGLYLRNYNENETHSFKTKFAKTQLEAGWNFSGCRLGLGHNEQFETGSIENFNMSYDYVRISYRLEF